MKQGNGEFEIWDSHAHILPPERTRGLVRWIKRAFPGHPSREDYTPDEILSELKGEGVARVFNLVFPLKEAETDPLNLFNMEMGREHPEIVPFGSLHVDTPRKDEVVEKCVLDYGLAGIKLHPYVQGFEAFSPSFDPVFWKLDELGKPLLVHTGFDLFYGMTQDIEYLRTILEEYQNMPVVLVHSMFPRFELVLELLDLFPQVYLDMTNVISVIRYFRRAGESNGGSGTLDVAGLEGNLEYFDALMDDYSHRIMFGTDHPAGMGSPRQIYADLDALALSDGARKELLSGTAKRFYAEHIEGG